MLSSSEAVASSLVVKVQSDDDDDDDHGETVDEEGAEVWTMMSPAGADRSVLIGDTQPQQQKAGMTNTTVKDNVEPGVALSNIAPTGTAEHSNSSTPLPKYPRWTRRNLTAIPVRTVTKRWDAEDDTEDAVIMDVDQELPSHPVTCWWLSVSSVLTVLCYAACLGLIPFALTLLTYYLAFREEQVVQNGNETQPPRGFGILPDVSDP